MAVEYRFMKNFVAVPTDSASFTIPIPQTLVTATDEFAICVSINGQQILRRTVEPIGTFSKYYFETTIDRTAYELTPETANIEEFCGLTITLYANPSFIAPGYTSGAQECNILSSDIVYISLWHTLVRNV